MSRLQNRCCLATLLLLGVVACSDQEPLAKVDVVATDAQQTSVGKEPVQPVEQALPDLRGAHAGDDPHKALNAEQLIKVALQHQQEGRPDEAMRSLDDALRRYPASARLHAVRGSLLLGHGKVTSALEDLELAHRLDPDNAEVLTNRAQAYRQFGRGDEALADLNRAIELAPDLLPARFNRGAVRYGQGDLEGALADFDYCVAVDPHSAAPYFNRASAYAALQRRDEAVADLQRFIELAESEEWKATAQKLLDGWRRPPAEAQEKG